MALSLCLGGARADVTLPGNSLLTDIWVTAIASQDRATRFFNGCFFFSPPNMQVSNMDRYKHFQSATGEWYHQLLKLDCRQSMVWWHVFCFSSQCSIQCICKRLSWSQWQRFPYNPSSQKHCTQEQHSVLWWHWLQVPPRVNGSHRLLHNNLFCMCTLQRGCEELHCMHCKEQLNLGNQTVCLLDFSDF